MKRGRSLVFTTFTFHMKFWGLSWSLYLLIWNYITWCHSYLPFLPRDPAGVITTHNTRSLPFPTVNLVLLLILCSLFLFLSWTSLTLKPRSQHPHTDFFSFVWPLTACKLPVCCKFLSLPCIQSTLMRIVLPIMPSSHTQLQVWSEEAMIV